MKLLWPRVTVEDLHRSRQEIEAAATRPRETQWAFLQELLRTRANTAIGRELRLGDITSVAEFRARVPITPYEDLLGHVARIKQGEADVLFPGRAYHFTRTTGTTGAPKDIPLSSEYASDVARAAGPFFSRLETEYPGCLAGGLAISGIFCEERTPAGIGIGQPTGAARCVFAGLGLFDWAPEPVFESTDFDARGYALAYFALVRDVRLLLCLAPSVLVAMFRKIEQLVEPLAADVEDGALRRGPEGLAAMRAQIAQLGELPAPNPAAAARLRASLATHGRFMPPLMWPNLRAIVTWQGGTYQHQLDAIAEVCPGIDQWSGHIGASESALFVPLERTWNGGIPTLHSTFYEAYPEGTEPTPENFVELDQLEVGGMYRLLLTNGRGMFRYPITDVYRVVGRHREVPIVTVSHRAGGGLNLCGEKLIDNDVVTAMSFANALSAALTEYQLAPMRGRELSGYVLLLEYRDEPPPVDELRRILVEFEEGLKRHTVFYARFTSQMLSPQLAVVPRGTFEAMRRKKYDGKRSDSQYKQARLALEFVDPWALDPVHVVGVGGELARPSA